MKSRSSHTMPGSANIGHRPRGYMPLLSRPLLSRYGPADLDSRNELGVGALPQRLALGGERHQLQRIAAEILRPQHDALQVLRYDALRDEAVRRDRNLRRL